MLSRRSLPRLSVTALGTAMLIPAAPPAAACDPPMFPAALYEGGGHHPVVCDIDGDGDLDLIYVGEQLTPEAGPGSRLVPGAPILINNGCGVFERVLIPVGRVQYSVAAGDMNHDGRPDLVFTTAEFAEDTPTKMWAEILLNSGDGTFTHAAEVQTSPMSVGAMIADFNIDGHPDVMILASTPEQSSLERALVFLAGAGDGSLAAPIDAIAGASYSLARVADFDEDGTPDIVCRYYDGEDIFIRVLRGTGTGEFTVLSHLLPNADSQREFRITDLNQDGHTDVVARTGASIEMYFGDGRGALLPQTLEGGAGNPDYEGLDIGDCDRDGDPDIVTTVHAGGDPSFIRTYLNPGGAKFDDFQDSPLPDLAREFELADLNADGAPDIVTIGWTPTSGGQQLVILGRGDGSFDRYDERLPAIAPHVLAAGDITGDGLTDIVFAAPLRVFPGIGKGQFGPPSQHGLTGIPSALKLADLDEDGDLDAVVTSDVWPVSVQTAMQVDGGAFGTSTPFSIDVPRDFAIGDFDGNGVSDIVTVSWESDSVSVLLGVIPVFYWPAIEFPHTMMGLPAGVAAGDVNGDSRVDIVVKHSYGGMGPGTSIYLGRGDGSFDPPHEYFSEDGQASGRVALADLDRDGDLDMCYGGLVVHLNDGRGDFSTQRFDSYYYAASLNTVIDVDGDGILDVLLGKSSIVLVLLGNGDGSFQPARQFFLGGTAARPADFDNDGDIDLLTIGSPVKFWTNRSPHYVPADLSGDGVVNGPDLAMLLGAWGACPTRGPCAADLDHNRIVNGIDLAMLLGLWS